MQKSNKSRLLEVMSIVFNEKINNLNEKISMNNFDKWDSLKHLNLLVALEEEFKIRFDISQADKMADFKSIIKYINKKEKNYVEIS